MNMCRLKVGFMNVNGCGGKDANKFDDSSFCSLFNSCDIFGFAETFFSDRTINDFSIPDYQLYHSLRTRKGRGRKNDGGVTVAVRHTVSSHVTKVEASHDDFIFLRISGQAFGWQRDLYLGCCYVVGPGSPIHTRYDQDIFELFFNDLARYATCGHVLVLGDINARTGHLSDLVAEDGQSHATNHFDFVPGREGVFAGRLSADAVVDERGRLLLDACAANDCSVLNGRICGDNFGRYTCFKHNGASVVDYAIVSSDFINCVQLFRVGDVTEHSDHAPLFIHVRAENAADTSRPAPPQGAAAPEQTTEAPRGYHVTEDGLSRFGELLNSEHYSTALARITLSAEHRDAEGAVLVEQLQSLLRQAADRSFSVKNGARPRARRVHLCAALAQMRHIVRGLATACNAHPQDGVLRRIFYSTRAHFRKLLAEERRTARVAQLAPAVHRMNGRPKQIWNEVRRVKAINKSSPPPPLPASIGSDSWVHHFGSIARGTNYNSLPDAAEVIQTATLAGSTDTNPESSLNQLFTLEELREAVSNLGDSEAATNDQILPSMIKRAMPAISGCVLACINALFSSGQFPPEWASGWITPLYKKGARTCPENYRGITVCSHPSKVYTSMLNSRFVKWLDAENRISPFQAGFRKGRGAMDHCVLLKTVVDAQLSQRRKTYTAFIDFKQAYDRVWRDGLFHKLSQGGADGRFLATVKIMYVHASTSVKLPDNRLTPSFTCDAGVRQGCNLSPMLFNYFINDLVNWLLQTEGADLCTSNGTVLPCLLYADDLMLLSNSIEGLQRQLDALAAYCAKWGMVVNCSKSQVLCFSSRKVPATATVLWYGGQMLDVVDEFQYLGVTFFWNGRFIRAIQQRKRNAEKAFYGLLDLTRDCDLSPTCLMTLYNSLVKSVLLYGSEVLGCESVTDRSPLEKLHNRAVRHILGVGRKTSTFACHGELGTLPVRVDVHTRLTWFFARSQITPNAALIDRSDVNALPTHSWIRRAYSLCAPTGFGFLWLNYGQVAICHALKAAIKHRFIAVAKQEWCGQLARTTAQNSKLGLFKATKIGHHAEPYLGMLPRYQRVPISKFRLSAHQLRVETGRHCRPPLPRDQRTCTRCPIEAVDDEHHLIFHCRQTEATAARAALQAEVARCFGL
jgi:exonuclease III